MGDGLKRRLWADLTARDPAHMPKPRKTIDPGATRAKLDGLVDAVRREAEGAESDPFDDAMLAIVVGVAEAMKTEADALAELEERMIEVARRV